MEFIGYNTQRVRFLVVILSAFFAGIAGALSCINFEIVTAENVSAVRSGAVLLAAFIGGMGSFFGPIIGAVLTVFGQQQAGAVVAPGQLPLGTRLLLVPRSFVFYLLKIFWPGWLSPFYPQYRFVSLVDREFWVPLVAVVTGTGLAVAWRRRYPQGLACGLAFVALVGPVSGLMQAGGQAVADRFVYLAIVPVTLGAAGIGVWLWRELARTGRAAAVVLLAGALVFFAARSREQIAIWHDELSVWENAWSHYPADGLINLQLAMALARRGRYAEALPYAETAREPMADRPLTHAILGLVYLRLQRPADAVPALELTLAKAPQQRGARYNLACAYAMLNRPADACRQLQRLLAEFPEAGPTVKHEPVLQRLDCGTGSP